MNKKQEKNKKDVIKEDVEVGGSDLGKEEFYVEGEKIVINFERDSYIPSFEELNQKGRYF